MPTEGGGSSLGELAPAMLDSVPYVGRLVGTLARVALTESEQAQIERCLIEALRIDDFVHKRRWRDYFSKFGKSGAMKAVQQQAALDLAGDVDLMAITQPPAATRFDDDWEKRAATERRVPESTRELARFVYATARTELDDALSEETFVPWTSRLAGSLTAIAQQRWDRLSKGDEERDRWARLVMNDREANPADVNVATLMEFGQRVGLRFEVSLVRNPNLSPIVERLDLCDRQRAELSMLAAAQGIRTALLLLLAAAAVGILLLAGEAGGGHLVENLFEAL